MQRFHNTMLNIKAGRDLVIDFEKNWATVLAKLEILPLCITILQCDLLQNFFQFHSISSKEHTIRSLLLIRFFLQFNSVIQSEKKFKSIWSMRILPLNCPHQKIPSQSGQRESSLSSSGSTFSGIPISTLIICVYNLQKCQSHDSGQLKNYSYHASLSSIQSLIYHLEILQLISV